MNLIRHESGHNSITVNWTNYQVELQSVITACEGLEAMDSSNIPMDETLYIEFLKRVQLPETLSRNALTGQLHIIEKGYNPITNIDGSLKGLGHHTRKAEVALLIKENRADEATEEEREEHKKGVASGKKGACEYNCNTWVIKSTVQDKVLEFGDQRARELTGLSTNDVFKFLIASGVNTSFGTVMKSMKWKIDEGVSASYSELLLGKKKKQSGILVMLLSSVLNGEAVKVE